MSNQIACGVQGIMLALSVWNPPALRSVCYYSSTSQDLPGKARFRPENIEPRLCTHIIYAFAKVNDSGVFPNLQSDVFLYPGLMAMKNINQRVKILFSIGGTASGSDEFRSVSANPTKRNYFASQAAIYLRNNGFDGLDVAWISPIARDREKFVLLIRALRRSFNRDAASSGLDRLLLSGLFPSGQRDLEIGYDIPRLSGFMDFINIMTYDFHGTWESRLGFNSPLYSHPRERGTSRAELNMDWVARHYVSLGAPKSKLNLGIATYGRTFRLTSDAQDYISAWAHGVGPSSQYVNIYGVLPYYEICEILRLGVNSSFDEYQRNPYIRRGLQWIGYENPQSVKEKACYAKQNGYGGLMFWEFSLDDFTGLNCGQCKFPLILTAFKIISNASSEDCPVDSSDDYN